MGVRHVSVLLICLCLCWISESKNVPKPRMLPEIEEYRDTVIRIIEYVQGDGRHASYNLLANLTDEHGPRLAPSAALERSIDDVLGRLDAEGFANVAGEEFPIPNWTPGSVYTAEMVLPRPATFALLPLGTSVGTPVGGIEASVVVVNSFEELDGMANTDIEGKIVVYNQPWVNYGVTNMYRTHGARRASEKGALAALVRSVADYSVYSPHTGVQDYGNATNQIPVACITQEDAEMLRRIQDRGSSITIKMEMDCGTKDNTTTRNVVAELTGATRQNETVIFGGHIDSWYVGNGVMDDMGGVVISWEAMKVMRALQLIPKRTVRAVFWSAEEIGVYGGEAYYAEHAGEVDSVSLVMESDAGTFTPLGIGFSGSDEARAIITDIMSLLDSIGATGVASSGSQADTGPWIRNGVPGANLYNKNDDYFFYHHTDGDTLTMQDPDDLDLCTIVWTTVAYIVADLDAMLPRD